jgi:maleylpyruvate isomerase
VTDLEQEPDLAVELCRQAQRRLAARVPALGDDDIRRPSRLPGWTVGHVLTHLARNADAHSRRLDGALAGHDVPKYAGGEEQRAAEIEAGAARPAADTVADLLASQERLQTLMDQCSERRWPNADFRGGSSYGVVACPAHRLREVEMHHVDLGLGYTPQDWPEEYVQWDLVVLLRTVPERLRSADDRRAVMSWLAGRADAFPAVQLDTW